MGVTLEETDKVGLDKFYYNEKLQTYYLVHGDTNVIFSLIEQGYRNEEGEVALLYRQNGFSFEKLTAGEIAKLHLYLVTLKPNGEKYYFVSNQLVK